MSARARILGWVLLVVLLALAGALVATHAVLRGQLDHRLDGEIFHETGKFRAYLTSADAMTPGAPNTVDTLLARYLERNLPEKYETFFSIVDGAAAKRSAADAPARLDGDRALVAELAKATVPAYGTVETAVGSARYGVVPVTVQGDPRRGALVIVEFVDHAAGEIDDVIRVMAAMSAAALLVAGLVGWLAAGRILAPVREMRLAAEQISESDLTRRIDVRGSDDVAALGRTFNTMLDRLERAFADQREFIDDAGHELRTPITIVRGHLELMGDDPADRRATTALVLDELGRMQRIVDDLLVLAKSGRPDFLVPERVDLADLTVETFTKARPLADRQWRLDGVAEVVVRADGQRLAQALLQLVSNAVRHTRPDQEIALGSSAAGGTARIWVRDTGEGVPPDSRARIFERFKRGSNARDEDGSGLGLPIVVAIAEAHGGQVVLDSTPGDGALFTIELPISERAPQEAPR
ncbi:sensor histidine kinase [Amycolatopsis sp. CA-230715]|uniref:sensor histidine kinase n=1 Tax=Amycolatopsis sp. CA-230715 TaxID=2745196 RepID=UPI001C039B89|nr:HAMP domain-containing sensor histidine kinase [Amycolatopsis sp. CA-230715]QWF83140.1 Adaptive-response sensory-kinase SasA [Amycolatopsis sp. CA-230715]